MDYQYRCNWYENRWPGGGMLRPRPRYRSLCEERCTEELKRLDHSLHREMDCLRRFYYLKDDHFYRTEHDITSNYYTQRDRIIDYWKREEYYEQRDYYYNPRSFNDSIYYNLMYTLSNPVPLQLENKTVPTETKKFIIISSAGAAEKPVEHKTLVEAEKEAKRLARQFPKQEFTIFETKKSYKVADKPVDVTVFV